MFRVAQVDRDDLCVKLRGEKRRSSNSNDRRGRQPAGTGRGRARKGGPGPFLRHVAPRFVYEYPPRDVEGAHVR